MAIAVLFVGCESARDYSANDTPSLPDLGEGGLHGDLEEALRVLSGPGTILDESQLPTIAFRLNSWLKSESGDGGWVQDPMLARLLSGEMKQVRALDRLAKRDFSLEDVRFVEEVIWLQKTARWISVRPADPFLEPWLSEIRPRVGSEGVEQLAVAERLFDWVIRNLQLDPLLPYPTGAAASPGSTTQKGLANLPVPRQGLPGPGYRYPPINLLMFGHGDALQRAWLFSLLARQTDIDVVMLALEDKRRPGRPVPWLPAVLVGEDLYLFDTELGLPIPGPGGKGIATLAQLKSEESLWAALDLDDERKYRVSAEQLGGVVALIEAGPGYLSLRGSLLEKRLRGEDRLVLAVAPGKLARRLKECPGVKDAAIWPISYEAIMFQEGRGDRLKAQDRAVITDYLQNDNVMLSHGNLFQGRKMHVRGDLEGTLREYMRSRPPNESLRKMETDRDVQKELGLVKTSAEDTDTFEARVRATKEVYVRGKQDANFWLGLANFEHGKYDIAQDWFLQHTLVNFPTGPWTHGAKYNLARTYEEKGEIEKAREIYLRDDSPQKHGNVLRARMLKRRT